jgi:hypothetical protein
VKELIKKETNPVTKQQFDIRQSALKVHQMVLVLRKGLWCRIRDSDYGSGV